jgi:Cd2+/Zn2+-exporting ATPase
MTSKDSTRQQDWTVTGMDCAACAQKITSAVARLPGVSEVQVADMSERLSLRLDSGAAAPGATEAAVEAAVRGLGYGITPKAAGRACGTFRAAR